MFCRNCGSKVEGGARFCPVCGEPIAAEDEAPAESQGDHQPAPAAEARPTTPVPAKAKRSKKPLVMNCLPFLGHEKWEAFFMRVDLRVKHDIEARKAAIGLFELGHGYKSAAIALSLPVEAVRRWQEIYRAFGSEVLLRMDGKQGRYTYEQKVAAASAVVDGGMTKTEAMAAFGIMSMSPLKKWCALYRRGGAEALRPRPKGRPKGSKARPRTHEEELEERCRRLEAEVAYLKKLRALVERDGL